MTATVVRYLGILLWAWIALLPATPASAQSHTGDELGDLVHILRDATTGQPILQQRWIDVGGGQLAWAYCPVPVDAAGAEIPFAPLSCDPDPAEQARLVEVDYFGRLSSGRTKERNLRMHFDEVISGINAAEAVAIDEAGRLKLGSTCSAPGTCATWKTVDSPLENLALYWRLMKYGHIQTDPLEIDVDAAGDPNAGTVYHPALAATDWPKFLGVTRTLLPRSSENQCFPGASFDATCAVPQALITTDFAFVTSLLAGAADKTGRVTPDLVQYLNRILKVPIATTASAAPVATLPALVRDVNGQIAPAGAGLPAPADERFVDFSAVTYSRVDWFNSAALLLQSPDAGLTWQPTTVQLLQWLAYINGPPAAPTSVMPGFILWATDSLRVVEFIHEYAIPANLWGGGTGTRTTVPGVTLRYRASSQTVTLSALVSATTPVNGGSVTFSVRAADGGNVGTPVTSAAVANGAASAIYTLPGDTSPATLSIIAVYSGTGTFANSSGSGSLVVGLADSTTTVDAATTPVPAAAAAVPLTAHVSWVDTPAIAEGTVTFTLRDGAGATIGTPVTAAVTGGLATASYLLPGAMPAQRLVTTAAFSGSSRFAASQGTNTLSIGCLPVTILPFTLPAATVSQPYAASFTTDGIPPTSLTITGLPAGLSTSGAMITGTPTTNGTFTVSVAATDAAGCTGSATYTLRVAPSTNVIAVAPDAGLPGVVRHFEPSGVQVNAAEYAPYGMSWTGGVRVARADFTGDGVADTVVAPGPGSAPLVSIYDGASSTLFVSLPVFEPTFTGGVNVAAGDITGDGRADLVVASATGTPRVRVFNGRTGALVVDFVPFTAGASGVFVAVGDMNGDTLADLLVGAGPGGEPRLRAFNAANGAVLHDFLVFGTDFRGGVHVASGDLNGDGRADLIAGAGAGGGPYVRAYNGDSGALIREFLAFDAAFTGGVRVAAADLNADGHAEIVTAAGPGGAPEVKVVHGTTNAVISTFLAYPSWVTSGVFVATPWRPPAPAVTAPAPPATAAVKR